MTIFESIDATSASLRQSGKLAALLALTVFAFARDVSAQGAGGQITNHPMQARLVQPLDENSVAVNLFDIPLGVSECAAPRALQIQYVPPSVVSGVVYIFVSTTGDCALPADTTDTSRFINGGEAANLVGSPALFPKTLNADLLSTKTVLGAQCNEGATQVDLSIYGVCIVYRDTAGSSTTTTDIVQIRVDTKPPEKLTTVAVVPGDSSLNLTWTAAETLNVRSYRVLVVKNSDGSAAADTRVIAPASSTRIDNLENGVEYSVYVSVLDLAGNEGEPSDVILATPVPTCDFWNCYQGREKGGFCFISTAAYGSYDAPFVQVFRDFRDRVLMKSSYGRAFILWYYKNGLPAALWLMKHEWARRAVGVALVVPYVALWPFMRLTPLGLITFSGGALLVLSCAVILWRRRRAALMLAVLMLASAPAFAADDTYELIDVDEHTGRENVAPPPRFEVGVKVGPYYPAIDSDDDAQRQYGIFFADGDFRQGIFSKNSRLRVDAHMDVYVLQKWGLLGFTGTAGFWTASGKAKNCSDGACVDSDGNLSRDRLLAAAKTNDDIALYIFPLSIGIVYKLDIFWRRWGVPLIPYVRGGIDAYFWRAESGGKQARVPGSRYTNDLKPNGFGMGVTFGAHVNPGLAFALDVIEPDAARRAYSFLGIKGSYLTAEWMFAFIDDFGSASSWNLSHSTFNGGIAVEF